VFQVEPIVEDQGLDFSLAYVVIFSYELLSFIFRIYEGVHMDRASPGEVGVYGERHPMPHSRQEHTCGACEIDGLPLPHPGHFGDNKAGHKRGIHYDIWRGQSDARRRG